MKILVIADDGEPTDARNWLETHSELLRSARWVRPQHSATPATPEGKAKCQKRNRTINGNPSQKRRTSQMPIQLRLPLMTSLKRS
jgi:hypothetical protein